MWPLDQVALRSTRVELASGQVGDELARMSDPRPTGLYTAGRPWRLPRIVTLARRLPFSMLTACRWGSSQAWLAFAKGD
jgi:hypothetical protein